MSLQFAKILISGRNADPSILVYYLTCNVTDRRISVDWAHVKLLVGENAKSLADSDRSPGRHGNK